MDPFVMFVVMRLERRPQMRKASQFLSEEACVAQISFSEML
jgi:hypothetical protein